MLKTSEKYFRPNEVEYLLGDPSKAKNELNWKPSLKFDDLVKLMVEHDINEAQKELTLLKRKFDFTNLGTPSKSIV